MMRWLPTLVLLAGCAARSGGAAGSSPELAWAFEARPTAGEVRVVPIVGLHRAPDVSFSTFVGRDVPWERERMRRERTRQLAEVPAAVWLALPGAVNGELGLAWAGQFRSDGWPLGAEERVRAALEGRRPIDATLSEVAGRVGADATLFTWIGSLEGRPVSTEGFPGAVVETSCGPVLVDHADEPYLVAVRVGMALVTADGEVVLRYDDTYEAVLSGRSGPDRAARDLARGLAAEVAKVWAVDPALALAEP